MGSPTAPNIALIQQHWLNGAKAEALRARLTEYDLRVAVENGPPMMMPRPRRQKAEATQS